ncbi:hypothetical protein [Salinivibrio sp. ES.052]|uniref:hypothetical protein n=1 Tax=Salinivibrio sp. ES.052 TaxID=1882823 RepID=UPI000928454A|nr:hypothetical protein [Salinivibrio sp. ES.052]SIN93131.1 hypothetical protein SAMN05444724_1267 [Salinivibrio sp. ES.052]
MALFFMRAFYQVSVKHSAMRQNSAPLHQHSAKTVHFSFIIGYPAPCTGRDKYLILGTIPAE